MRVVEYVEILPMMQMTGESKANSTPLDKEANREVED